MYFRLKKIVYSRILKGSKYATGILAALVLLSAFSAVWTWGAKFQTKTVDIYPSVYTAESDEGIELWSNPENALDRSLPKDAAFADFNFKNSASSVPAPQEQETPIPSQNEDEGQAEEDESNEATGDQSAIWGRVKNFFSFAGVKAQEQETGNSEQETETQQSEDEGQVEENTGEEEIVEETEPVAEEQKEVVEEDSSQSEESDKQQETVNSEQETESNETQDESVTAEQDNEEVIDPVAEEQSDTPFAPKPVIENTKTLILSGFSSSVLEEELAGGENNNSAQIDNVTLKLSLASLPLLDSKNELRIAIGIDEGAPQTLAVYKQDKFIANSIEGDYFSIPLDSLFVNLDGKLLLQDIRSMRVYITAVSDSKTFAPVFVDGAWIELDYRVYEQEEDLPRVKLKKDRVMRSDKNVFLADELPAFIFESPNLTLAEIKAEVEKGNAEVLEDVKGVLKSPFEMPKLFEEEETDNSEQETGNSETQEEPATTEQETRNKEQETNNNQDTNSNDQIEEEEGSDKEQTTTEKVKETIKSVLPKEADAQNSSIEDVSVVLISPRGERQDVNSSIHHYPEAGTGHFKVEVEKPSRFTPGMHTLELQIKTTEAIYVVEQDFAWGVLALNINKSVYTLSDRKAYIQMGVLDDMGHTLCDADLYLEVTEPNGDVKSFSTDDGTISRSSQCAGDSFTTEPDYFLYYQFPLTAVSENSDPEQDVRVSPARGTYELHLTAETKNGSRSVTDSFEVKDAVAIDVERTGPTRIYPPADYEMSFTIIANEDFEGEIIETIPESFQLVGEDTRYKIQETNNNQIPNSKQLVWDVVLEQGEEIELSYTFDAPDISPEFYLLGPLRFTEETSSGLTRTRFVEERRWQIASDDPSGPNYAGTGTDSGPGTDCAWATPGNATGDTTNTSASCTIPGGTRTTNDLILTNFLFTSDDIPAGSTIDGVTVEVEWQGGSTAVVENTVQLTTNGSTGVGDNKSQGVAQTAKQFRTYGGAADNWNAGLSQADVISTNFGVILNYHKATGAASSANVFRVRITVEYTAPLIEVSGIIYEKDTSTPYDCSLNALTVSVKVNGAGTTSGTCTAASGIYTVPDISIAAAGNTVTTYLDGEIEKAVTVTRAASSSANISGVDLYVDHLITRHEDTGPITNSNLGTFDSSNHPDIVFEVDGSDNLTINNGIALLVWSGDTFTPGGSVTTGPSNDGAAANVAGDVEIGFDGELNMGANSLSVGGDFNNGGTFTLNGGQSTTFTATATGHAITGGGANFENIIFNGSGGGWSFQDAIILNQDMTLTAGTLSGTQNITVNGGDVTGNGGINLTGGTFALDGAGNFGGSTNWSFNNLTFGDGVGTETSTAIGAGSITVAGTLTVATNQTLDAGGKTWILAGSGTPISRSGTFEAGTSTVRYTSGTGVTALASAAMTGANSFYNLEVNGTGTFTAGVALDAQNSLNVPAGTLAMGANNLIVGSSGVTNSGAISVAGSLTQTASGTTSVRSSSGGTASVGGGGTLTFYNLTFDPSVASAPTFLLGTGTSQTITISNALTVGDGTNPVELDVDNWDPTLTVAGAATISANATVIPGAGMHTFGGDLSVSGTLSGAASGQIEVAGTVDGAGIINLTGGTFNHRVAAAENFGTTSGTNNWTFNNLTLSNSTGSPVTTTAASGGTGAIVVNSGLTVGLSGDSAGTEFDNETNDRTLDMHHVDITSQGTLSASSSAVFEVSGNWTNNGIFNEGTGAVIFNGTSSVNLNTGCTAHDNCSDGNFYDLEINKTGASANDDVVLTGSDVNIANTLTITDGELVQGALNVRIEGTATAVTIAGLGEWTNLSTGNLYLDGDVVNNGSMSFNANGSTCGDPNDIIITNITNTPDWSGSGNFILKDVDISNQNAIASIIVESGTDNGGNTGNWTFTGCTILISGKVFDEDETSFIGNPPCDDSTQVVSLRINAGSENTVSCSSSNGTFTFLGFTPNPGDILTIYLNNSSTPKANLVMVMGDGDVTNADLYENTVIVRDNDDGTMAISDTLGYDSSTDATNMLYDSVDATPDTMTISSGTELHIWSGTNFTAAGTITTSPSSDASGKGGDIHISSGATLGIQTNALSIGGDLINEGTFSKSAGQTTTFTATAAGHSIELNGNHLENAVFNGVGGGWSFASSSVIDSDLTMTAGTLSGTVDIEARGEVSGAGTIALTGGAFEQRLFADENFGTTSGSGGWSFNNLVFSNGDSLARVVSVDTNGTGGVTINGRLLISKTGDSAATTLNAGSRTWTIAGSNANPFDVDEAGGALNAQTSVFEFTTENGSGDVSVENASYYNLVFTGSETYTPEGATTASNNLTINTNATLGGSQNITVNGNVAGAGSVNITGGTFEHRIGEDRDFGAASGSNNWVFNNLTFSNSDNSAHTVVTQTGGAGNITINGRLLISKAGDSAATTLNAGDKTYVLANTNEQNPFDRDEAGGVLNAQTSTFEYAGDFDAGDVHIEDASYFNVTLGGPAIENYNPVESSISISNNLVINSNATLKGTNSITVNGSVSGGGAINLTGGIFEQRVGGNENFGATGGSSNWIFNNLRFSNSSGSPQTITAASGGTGQLRVAGTWTIGPASDSSGTTFNNETNDRVLDMHHVAIGSNGTLTASSSAGFTVSGNWVNSGTLNEGTGTVTFDGSSSATLDSGCSDADTCTAQNFYNVVINKSSSTDPNDNLTLTNSDLRVTNTITISDGELIQGLSNVRAEGATAVSVASGTGAKWTNISAGDLILGGSFSAGNGEITFQGAGSGCGDADLIHIRSTDSPNGTLRTWTGSGATFNFNDVEVEDQTTGGSTTIEVFSGTDSGTAGNWVFSNCPVPTTPITLHPGDGTITGSGDGTSSGVIQNEGGSACSTGGVVCANSIDDTLTGSIDNDTTFNQNDQSETSGTQFYELTDMPADFQSMDSLDIEVTWRDIANGTDDLILSARVFESDETTALTNLVTIHTHDGADTGYTTTTISFTLEGTNNKTVWDGARLMLDWNYTRNGPANDQQIRVTNAQLNAAYISPVTVSGNVYEDEATTALVACDGTTNMIAVNVRGNTYGPVPCNSTDGSFTITGVEYPSLGDKIFFWIDGVTCNDDAVNNDCATTLIIDDGDGILDDVVVRKSRLILRHDNDGPVTNLDLLNWDNSNDADIVYSVNPSTFALTTENGIKLIVNSNDTYQPGAAVTTSPSSSASATDGDVLIQTGATLGVEGNNLSVGGDFTNQGIFSKSPGQATTFTATATGHTITDGGNNFEFVTFNGAGGGWSFADSTIIDSDLTISAGTLSGSVNINVNGGDITGAGTINMTGGTVTLTNCNNSNNLGGGSYTFANLTIGDTDATPEICALAGDITVSGVLTIDPVKDSTNDGLSAGAHSIFLTGSGTPLVVNGSFIPGTSLVRYTGTSATSVAATTYYNLEIVPPAASTHRIGTAGSQSMTVNNDFIIGDGINGVIVDPDNWDPFIHVGRDFVINANAVYLAAGDDILRVSRDFTNNGTFTHNNGTVIFTTATTSTIQGSGTAFYNLTSTAVGKTILFTAGETFRTDGLLRITGASGSEIVINSTDSTTPLQWFINHQGTDNVTYANISNSGCDAASTDIEVFDGTSINGGNNGACWNFAGNPPTSTNVVLNGGSNISLIPGTFAPTSVTGTATDPDGWENLDQSSTTAVIYRSGVGSACSNDLNNCYTGLSCSFSNCSGNSCDVTCNANIRYFAEPTDTDAIHENENWLGDITVYDAQGQNDTGTSIGVEMLTLLALEVPDDINYGSLVPGDDTGATNQTTTIRNVGNVVNNPDVRGTDIVGPDTIAVGNQKFSISAFTYSSGGTPLSGIDQSSGISLPKPISTTPVEDVLHWGLGLPSFLDSGNYTGQNTFTSN